MRVQAINNGYTNQKTKNNKAFTGEFERNQDIEMFMKYSRYEDMVRFRNILAKMKKKNDGDVYVLEKKTYVNEVSPDDFWFGDEDETEKVTTGFELSVYKKDHPEEKKWVGGFEDDGFYTHSLGEVVERLEEKYPTKAGKITRGKMSEEIYDIMYDPLNQETKKPISPKKNSKTKL